MSNPGGNSEKCGWHLDVFPEYKTCIRNDRSRYSVADPVGFDEVLSNPLLLVRWRPFTTSLAVLLSLAEHLPISIRYSF